MKNLWERVPLDEAVFLQEGPGIRSYEYQKGGYPMINVRCVQDGYIDLSTCNSANVELAMGKWKHFQVNEGDILFTISGSIGRTAIVKKDDLPLLMNTSVVRFRSKTKRLRDDFFFYYLQSSDFLAKLHALSSGTAQKNVGPTHLKTMDVPLPPLSEQKRIVGILDEAFDGIAIAKANAEKNLQNASGIFESRLQSIFTQRGKGWVDRQLASLCHEITVGHVGPMKTQYKETGIPFLRSQNIRPFEVSMDNSMFIDKAFHRALKKSQLRPGDLAIVRTGYPGTAAVIPPELPDSNCSDLVIVRSSKEVSPHFLAAFFNSAFGKQLVLGKIVGAAQKHFNITAAKGVMLHIPPMPQQLAIIAIIDSLRKETQHLASIYERKITTLEKLKKSLLHQAFNAELGARAA